jgi:predicted negative regulator of RcsB-dependent stress response
MRPSDVELRIGNRHVQTEALVEMGDAQHATGDREAARPSWQAALSILEELGHPDAEPVRVKLLRETG